MQDDIDYVGMVIAEDADQRARKYPSNASYFVTSEAMQTCNELRQQLADVTAERDELRLATANLSIYESFPGYLIDHCEGETVYEENLQHWLAAHIAALNKPAGVQS